jgi:hypothetical protein
MASIVMGHALTRRLPCRAHDRDALLAKLIKRPRAKGPRPENEGPLFLPATKS